MRSAALISSQTYAAYGVLSHIGIAGLDPIGIIDSADDLPVPPPSVVVVGPDCNGDIFLACSMSAETGAPVLCLDVEGGASRMLKALHAGAAGYCDGDREDLASGVLNLASGNKFVPHHLMSHLVDAYLRLTSTNPIHSIDVPSGQDLTTREMEVIVLLVNGNTSRDISRRLVISEHTVKNHIRHIMDKLDLSKRADIVSWYYKVQVTGFV